MKHTHLYPAAIILLFALLLSAPAQADLLGVRVSNTYIRREADSLHLEMTLHLNALKVSPGVAYTFTPVLRSRERLAPLPPVVVSGKRRARFDRREQRLLASASAPAPFCLLTGDAIGRNSGLVYIQTIAYQPWMEGASLVLMQESKDCCTLELLGIDVLLPSLALNSTPAPVALPASEIVPASVIAPAPKLVTASPALCLPCTSMVSYLVPDVEADKQRSENATLYIDYPLNRYEVQRHYKRNATELQKLDSLLRPFRGNTLATMKQLRICGYASPEGPYQHNEELASNRARHFMHYMMDAYRLPTGLFDVRWVAEDWVGLSALLRQEQPPYCQQALNIIENVDLFAGREKQLMDLQGGDPYRQMRLRLFPRLRRLQVTVGYEVRRVSNEEAVALIYTHPQMLSLQEMYGVARYYRPGTEQYREIYEIAAYHFPHDAVAHINAASAVIMAGDFTAARIYLEPFGNDPRSWNDQGVLALMEGRVGEAIGWFRKALGVEPHKARKNLEIAEQQQQQQPTEQRP